MQIERRAEDCPLYQRGIGQTLYNPLLESGAATCSSDRRSAGTPIHASVVAPKITNAAANAAEVTVFDAYTGNVSVKHLQPHATFSDKLVLDQFYGWYDLIVTVGGDPNFEYELAGHVETGQDSFSDPALGGLVTLKG